MSKEYLEAKTEDISKLLYEVYDVPSGICEYIDKALQRLEAIDNSNHSEALECLEKIVDKGRINAGSCCHWRECLSKNKCVLHDNDLMCTDYTRANTIKQALINFNNITKQINDASGKSAISLLNKIKDKLDDYTYNNILESLLKTQNLERENAECKRILNVIKQKNVDTKLLRECNSVDEYNAKIKKDYNSFYYKNYRLAEEEFDTLKRYVNG